MALPKNSTPIYNLTIPSNNKTVKFRPFLVKEEKALLLAQQSEDATVMINTLQSVIKDCIVEKIDVSSLAVFDLEYIFTQIRAKSVGEEVELIFKCGHCDDEKAKVKLTFDLSKLEVYKDPEHTNKISLFDNVGIVLKYPSIDVIKKLDVLTQGNYDDIFSVIIECIDYIFDDQEIYYAKETPKQELETFLNDLNSAQFSKIQKFFETMPKIKQDIDFTCPVCNTENHTTLSGLSAFF
jgi:transcription elongation factor Elf1